MNLVTILQAFVSGLLIGGVYALIAIGLNLIFGVMKIINFSHGALMAVGMYGTYWLFKLVGIDPYLSVIPVGIFLLMVGALIQHWLIRPILGYTEEMQLLLTLGLALIFENLCLLFFSPDFRTLDVEYLRHTLLLGGVSISLTKFIAFLFSLLTIAVIHFMLKKTYLGKAIRACAQDKEGSMLSGVNVNRINYLAFGIGTVCVGIAGAIIIPFFYVFPNVGSIFLLTAFIIVVLGGLGNFWGSFVAALIIGLAHTFGEITLSGDLKYLYSFVIFILCLLFKPSGIFKGE